MNTQYTVAPRRASVNVLNWGDKPFGFVSSKRGFCGVPNRFRVETFSDSVMWIGETKIDGDQIFYRFSLKLAPNFVSPWSIAPTTAYLEVVKQIKQSRDSFKGTNLEKDLKKLLAKKSMEGCNGALLIGVTYLQTHIRKRFPCLAQLISEFESKHLIEKQHQQRKIKNDKKRAERNTQEIHDNKRVRAWNSQLNDNVGYAHQNRPGRDKAGVSVNHQSLGYHVPPPLQNCCCSPIPARDDDEFLLLQELSQGFPEESHFLVESNHSFLEPLGKNTETANGLEIEDMMEESPLREEGMQEVKEEETSERYSTYDQKNIKKEIDFQNEILRKWSTDHHSLEQDIPSFLDLDEHIVHEDMMLVISELFDL